MDTVEFIFSAIPKTLSERDDSGRYHLSPAPSWGGGCHFGRQAIGWARGPRMELKGSLLWSTGEAGGRR